MSTNQNYNYDSISELQLNHLDNTFMVISKMSGGNIPEDKMQYFVNSKYKVANSENFARTGGFSIQLDQIPQLCMKMLEVYRQQRNLGEADTETKFVLNELLSGDSLNCATAKLEVYQEEQRFKENLITALSNPETKKQIIKLVSEHNE